MARVASIEAVLSLDATQWERTLKRSTKSLKKMATDSRAIAAATGVLLTGAAAGLGRLSQELFDAGQNALELRANLDAAFDGFELERITEQVRELGATPPYSEEQFANAAKAFKAFGGDVESIEKDLVRAGNLAARTGGSFDTLSKAVASFGVRAEATNQLREVANISPQQLEQFGAVLDKTGKNLDFTGQNADKAKKALRDLLDANYAGAMDEVVLASDALAGSFQLLKEEAGQGLAEVGEGLSGFLLPVVEGLRDLPQIVKTSAGVLVALTGAAAAATAGIIGLGLAAGPLAGAFSAGASIIAVPFTRALWLADGAALAMNTTLGALGLTIAGIGLTVTAVIGPLVLLTKQYELTTAAQEKLLEVELARAKNQKLANQLTGKSVEQLREEGRTSKELASGILALQERIEAAREVGNDSLKQTLIQQVKELKDAKEQLAEAEAIQRERDQAVAEFNSPEAQKARQEAADEQRKAREEQEAADKAAREKALQAELQSIELRLAREEITVQESLKLRAEALNSFQATEQQKQALLIETARTEKALAEEAKRQADADAAEEAARAEALRSSTLQARQEALNLQKASGNLSNEDELEAIENILRTFKLSQDERVAYTQQAAQLETQIRKEEADKQKAIEQELASELEKTRSLERDAIGDEIDRLQKETEDTGKNNTSAIQSAIQESLRLQVESIRAEADRAKSAAEGAATREQIEKNAQLEIQAAIRDTKETEEQAVQDQIDAINELRGVRQEAENEARGFGKDPFGIEDLNKSIQESLNVQATTSQQAQQQSTAQAAQSVFPTTGAITSAPVPTVEQQQGTANISGEIRISVEVDGGEVTDVQTTGLDGRFSEIARNARGMTGRVSIA